MPYHFKKTYAILSKVIRRKIEEGASAYNILGINEFSDSSDGSDKCNEILYDNYSRFICNIKNTKEKQKQYNQNIYNQGTQIGQQVITENKDRTPYDMLQFVYQKYPDQPDFFYQGVKDGIRMMISQQNN